MVAPAVWFALLGLPGAAAYKAVNTADSMIGHDNERFRDFGRFAARLDDLVNLPASRLGAVWIVAAAATIRGASPAGRVEGNPEGRIPPPLSQRRLAGSRHGGRVGAAPRRTEAISRGGSSTTRGWETGAREATWEDIGSALRLYRRACALQIGTALLVFLAIAP